MALETIRCLHEGDTLEGLIARPEGDGPFPTVMVMHSAHGLRDQVRDTIAKLASRGYLAIATDMYGVAVQAAPIAAAHEAYGQFIGEGMAKVRSRSLAWLEAVRGLAEVDPARLAGIGYCFGGHCVLELARAGAELQLVVSYHGTLKTHAPAQPCVPRCEVVAYCGAQDPFAPVEDIDALRRELTEAKVRYQITVFGEAAHGFTDPDAERLSPDVEGIRYHATAHRVSWNGTLTLLEAFLEPGQGQA